VLVAAAALGLGLASGVARSQPVRIVPSFGITESYSDNVEPTAGQPPQSSWVTSLVPGIRIDLAGVRVKGLFDAHVNYSAYASASRLSHTEKYLNSFVNVDIMEKWLFLDAHANIAPQNASAFGAPATAGASVTNPNRVETTTYQAAPYIRGHFSAFADYQLRFSETAVHTNDLATPDSRTSEWAGRIASPLAKTGWAVDGRALTLRNRVVGSLDDSRVRGSLTYAFDQAIHVSVSEGYEATDFAAAQRQTGTTPGVGLEWAPGVRTQFSGIYERRFFGSGHTLLFTHRTPLTAWRLASTKDATALPAQLQSTGMFSMAGLMEDLLTSAIPDPEARAQAVRRRLEATGISPTSALSSNVLTTRPFVFRETTASFALLGRVNTEGITLSSREQRTLGDVAGLPGAGGDENFRQNGVDANVAHRLTPLTTLTFLTTYWRTESLTSAARTRQHLYTLFVTTQLGPKTSASLGFRRTDFTGLTEFDSYRENAVFGTISIHM
jgi:uncharacterized protein (PEP-CTERM system associated)